MADSGPTRIGTRGSLLARTQTRAVAAAWAAGGRGRQFCEVVIRTAGDDPGTPLDQPGRPGVFVSALREALLAGRVDAVVHSMKDLPSAPADGITVAAVPARADARDVLVSRDGSALDGLRAGAVVGTSSPRRAAALGRLRPDVVVRPIRGNVDTRLAKLAAGQFDAVVMAAAGLGRIGRLAPGMQLLDVEQLVPAPAQGALAVECRAGDPLARELAELDDPAARVTTSAERTVLAGISAACTTAVGVHARAREGELNLLAELHDHRHVRHRRVVRSCGLPGEWLKQPAAAAALAERLGRDVATLLTAVE